MKDKKYENKVKYEEKIRKNIKNCSCGWRCKITNKYFKMICPNCGNMVYLRKKDEFMAKMKDELKK